MPATVDYRHGQSNVSPVTLWFENAGHDGEGVVVKRHDFVNRGGQTIFAKVVLDEFKVKHEEVFGKPIQKQSLEDKFANGTVTDALIDKERAKTARTGR